jgi:multiple sugar transport system permease protein
MTAAETSPAGRTAIGRWFEPRAIGTMAPGTKVVVYGLLIFWSAFVLFPLYWLVITSFKEPIDVNAGARFLPFVDFQPSLHAWRELLVADWDDTVKAYINSIIIAFLSTALCVLTGSLAAYALARIRYRPRFGTVLLFVLCMAAGLTFVALAGVPWQAAVGAAVVLFFFLAWAIGTSMLTARQVRAAIGLLLAAALIAIIASFAALEGPAWGVGIAVGAGSLFLALGLAVAFWFKGAVDNGDILFWMISQRILPPVVTIVPVYIMFQSVHLLDTHLALILAYTVVNLPIVVWLMHDFFITIPIDLEESAQLDGATRIGTFWEIVLPLAKPGLAATTLLVLILSWNEYLLALFLSTTRAQTMPILVAAMNAGERGILWWNMAVVIILMIIPVVLMALVLQRFIAKGILLGAVKG